jgi:ferric-dicitrate binding protein FerR (iron transport regulator)
MLRPRLRLFAFGLAAAGIAGAGLLTHTGLDLRSSARADAAELTAPAENPAHRQGGSIRVDAPATRVDVDKERGNVRVTAPHTDVRVDPDKGQVTVRAPYVNLDIRW